MHFASSTATPASTFTLISRPATITATVSGPATTTAILSTAPLCSAGAAPANSTYSAVPSIAPNIPTTCSTTTSGLP